MISEARGRGVDERQAECPGVGKLMSASKLTSTADDGDGNSLIARKQLKRMEIAHWRCACTPSLAHAPIERCRFSERDRSAERRADACGSAQCDDRRRGGLLSGQRLRGAGLARALERLRKPRVPEHRPAA